MVEHRADMHSHRRPDEFGTVFAFACSCGQWRQEVFVPDRVEVYRQYVVQPAVKAVFEAGMAFERHVREVSESE